AAELVAIMRTGRAGRKGKTGGNSPPASSSLPASPALPALPAPPALPALWISAGALMLAAPFLAAPAVARYLAAPVWLAFIFLLDPINARLGGRSLIREFTSRRYDRLITL